MVALRRQIKRYFTGDLEAPVPGYPPFPGTEINLLRAQIARITAGVCVSPAGFFEVDDEAEPAAIKVGAVVVVLFIVAAAIADGVVFFGGVGVDLGDIICRYFL